ncbi:MAG: hypothetical protein ACLU30_05470 [Odoribacter splanchnicus]
MEDKKTQLTNEAGIPVGDNQNSAQPVPALNYSKMCGYSKNAHFNRERIPERIVHRQRMWCSVLSPSRTILPVTPKRLFF